MKIQTLILLTTFAVSAYAGDPFYDNYLREYHQRSQARLQEQQIGWQQQQIQWQQQRQHDELMNEIRQLRNDRDCDNRIILFEDEE
jgi:23S rRNA maturation mini-RNase III